MISKAKSPIVGIIVLLIEIQTFACEKGRNPYLTMENKLTKRLVVENLQSGFVGLTGERWVIETTGAWTYEEVMNRESKIKREGKLSTQQVKAIADAIQVFDVAGLPTRAGKRTINPRLITVTFGRKKSELTLEAGTRPPAPRKGEPLDVTERIGGIMNAVQSVLGPQKEKKPKGK